MKKFGVHEEGFESFISQIYDSCKKLDLMPDKIAYYIEELLKLSKDAPLSQIADYIKQRTHEKIKLEKDIDGMQEKLKQLEEERLIAEKHHETALENERMTSSEIKWCSDFKAELKKFSIPIEDFSLFAKAVRGLAQYGYDVDKIIAEYSDLEFLKSQIPLYRRTIQALENKHDILTMDSTSL